MFYAQCESLHHMQLYAVHKMPTGITAKSSVYEMNEEYEAEHLKVKQQHFYCWPLDTQL